jgi:hypothetical protein
MKKLRLDLEKLAVASFQTTGPGSDDGVQAYGFAWSDNSICPGTTTTHTSPP